MCAANFSTCSYSLPFSSFLVHFLLSFYFLSQVIFPLCPLSTSIITSSICLSFLSSHILTICPNHLNPFLPIIFVSDSLPKSSLIGAFLIHPLLVIIIFSHEKNLFALLSVLLTFSANVKWKMKNARNTNDEKSIGQNQARQNSK